MPSFSTAQFRAGLKLLLEGEPCSIIENEFVKPGKGQAFNRVKIRNLLTGATVARNIRSGESFEGADVFESDMQFLYRDGDGGGHFMDTKTYEQFAAPDTAMEEAGKWLKGQEVCSVTIWDGRVISIEPPQFVELKISETDPGAKGDTAQGGTKMATLETGAQVRTPLFVQTGETIRIDTRKAEYIGRARDK